MPILCFSKLAMLYSQMSRNPINLLLADDDEDDCLFFKEALEELPLIHRLLQ